MNSQLSLTSALHHVKGLLYFEGLLCFFLSGRHFFWVEKVNFPKDQLKSVVGKITSLMPAFESHLIDLQKR